VKEEKTNLEKQTKTSNRSNLFLDFFAKPADHKNMTDAVELPKQRRNHDIQALSLKK
jgi:hypothetical protein